MYNLKTCQFHMGNSNVIPMWLHLHTDYQNLAINQMPILELNEWDVHLLNDWLIRNFIWWIKFMEEVVEFSCDESSLWRRCVEEEEGGGGGVG